ncbi:MAG: hypothetical protein S4CHLAM102_02630 [Chlamydiia bacterium]|nr:hypothetical protein [Chlamydiia bacterium]
MFDQKLGFVIFFVNNPLESKEFYSNLLGLDPVEESATFVMYAMPNGVMLGLWSRHTAEPDVVIGGGGCEIAFGTDDVDALYEDWSRKALVLQKPTELDFGRTFVVADRDGHRIRAYKMKTE